MTKIDHRNTIRILKYVRNILLFFTGAMLVVLILARAVEFMSPEAGFVAALVFGGFILSAFLVQVLIVLFVGKPQTSEGAIFFPSQPTTKHREDVVCEDWLGTNASLRSAKILIFVLLLMIFVSAKNTNASVALYGSMVLLISILWSVLFKYSRITFQSDGILFESASSHTWGFGRKFFVPYPELKIRQPRFWVGEAISFRHGGRWVYMLTWSAWGSSFHKILDEIVQRLPSDQYELFPLYKN